MFHKVVIINRQCGKHKMCVRPTIHPFRKSVKSRTRKREKQKSHSNSAVENISIKVYKKSAVSNPIGLNSKWKTPTRTIKQFFFLISVILVTYFRRASIFQLNYDNLMAIILINNIYININVIVLVWNKLNNKQKLNKEILEWFVFGLKKTIQNLDISQGLLFLFVFYFYLFLIIFLFYFYGKYFYLVYIFSENNNY